MQQYTTEAIDKKIKKRKKFKKVIAIFFYPIIICILIVNIVLISKKIIYKQDTISFLGYKLFTVSSGSMEPTLKIGDIIIVKDYAKESIKVNDIITFKENENFITHRIIEIDKGKYKTKGDNNNSADVRLIDYSEIQGRLVGKIPKIGLLIINVKTLTGTVILGIIIYVIFSIMGEQEGKREVRHKKRKEYEEKISQ